MNQTQVSIFKDLFVTKEVPYIVRLDNVFDRIKTGKSKLVIEQIRASQTKEDANNLKKKLPCVLFSGEFSERSKNGLIKHSGLMIVDFDNYPDDSTLLQSIEEVKSNPYVVAVFISPSGNGIKAVISIPNNSDKISHEKYFKAFAKEFDYPYFDKSNCNVDRVCYESYDPNIYINYSAKVYSPILEDNGFSITDRVPLIPISDEDVIIEKIMKFKWSKDFVEGERNAFLFDLAGCFCEYGINELTAVNYINNNVVYGDFSESETINTIKSAYKRRSFGSKYFENYQIIDKIKKDIKTPTKELKDKYNIDEKTINEIKEEATADDFWFINDKNKISITPLKYKQFLERNGFKKHFPNNSERPQFVSINSNRVKLTSTSKIKDFVLDYLTERKEIDVWNYCANYQNLFSEQFLLMLESIDLIMLADTRDTSYLAFKNGILEITKNTVELKGFVDFVGYIWDSHILPRDFIEVTNYENDYQKFINNISGNNPFPIEITIGYLLSTYKNRSNNKAVILNDEVISENPEGGTGKGLFVQGLSQIRNTSIIDGKQFDSNKSFPYQTVSLDTKILVFDDVKKNFDFEDKFSLVTEGMTLERKNKDAIKLNVHDSPKIVMSTNYAIKGEGNSHNRRRHEIEIAQYYGKDLTPDDEFGRQLFDEWDDNHFSRFDNYMVNCIQLFLKNGLIDQSAKNIQLRKFIASTSFEFYEWTKEDHITHNERIYKAKVFEDFINEYQDYKKFLTQKKFKKWIELYSSFIGATYSEGVSIDGRWCIVSKIGSHFQDKAPF
jgi:hypothetical protein